MTGAPFKIDTRDDLLRLINICSADPDGRHRLPCYQALLHGRIGFWAPLRGKGQGDCKRFLAAVKRPAVVIIGDDDHAGSGPDGWPTAQRLMAWAKLLVVHGAGSGSISYEAFVLAAELLGRVVVVECSSATVDAWTSAGERWAPQAVKQAIIVTPGLSHPSPYRRRAAH